MAKSVTVSLYREGSFHVHFTRSNANQCGNVGTSILQYRVSIRGLWINLGPSRWLCDNNDIPNYFTRRYARVRDFNTCENIAEQACRDFRKIVESHGSVPDYISVAVSGIPGSWITCEWSRE